MKQYGFNKATEFSKKQINVIYAKAKKGELKVEEWVIKEFYDLSDYYGYDDNKSVEERERYILKILNSVFDGNNEEAQEEIDNYTNRFFELMSKKEQAKVSREILK